MMTPIKEQLNHHICRIKLGKKNSGIFENTRIQKTVEPENRLKISKQKKTKQTKNSKARVRPLALRQEEFH